MPPRLKNKPNRAAGTDAPSAGSPSSIELLGVAVRGLTFAELPMDRPVSVAQMMESGALQEHTISLEFGIQFPQPEFVELSVTATVEPAGSIKPFSLSVKVAGVFKHAPGISNRAAAEIMNELGVRMLMPFAREAVMTTMTKTIFGPIILQPMIVNAPFNREFLNRISG
jgi:hypothetical protein